MPLYVSPKPKRKGRPYSYIIIALVLIVAGYFLFIRPEREPQELVVSDIPQVEPELVIEKTQPQPKEKPPVPVEPNLPEISEPTIETDPQVAKLLEEASAFLEAKPPGIIEARDCLNEALPMAMSAQQRKRIKKKLSELADEWLFSRTVYPKDKLCGNYEVKSGDMFSAIGKKFKVPYEIIMEINKINNPEQLRAGAKIKVINGPFHTRIYRSSFTMDLYLQNTYIRSFPVGLGRPGRETPTGLWVVEPGGKLIKPTWRDPDTGKVYESEDSNYPLGSRWISLKGIKGNALGRDGFAIHGTKDPEQIGVAKSRGCIRLYNGDVILVYNLLQPGLSQAEIVD